MSPAKREQMAPEERRKALVLAAATLFATKGVAKTAVSHIVKEAGVAQGTFYLYFKSKEEVVVAVAESMAEGMVAALAEAVATEERGAVEKFLAFQNALATLIESSTPELTESFHQLDDGAIHDRAEKATIARLIPLMVSIIEQGVADGVFDVESPEVAARFVLGGFTQLDSVRGGGRATIEQGGRLALRALGYEPMNNIEETGS